MNRVILQTAESFNNLPTQVQFETWVEHVLPPSHRDIEMVIRVVGLEEMVKLNLRYRNQDQPTNILSFPFEPWLGIEEKFLGDLVICAPLVETEAQAQDKSILFHFAHLTIHGVLHLLGYTHDREQDTKLMEGLEIKTLTQLGFNNPYD